MANEVSHGEGLDVVGIGFGPSNVGLAIAIEEHNEQVAPSERITARFIEAQPKFGWHSGMLIPGTTMQISFMKDLVTQRNTRSRYSFASYLAEHDRLVDFINYQTFFPTRLEFHDYLKWAAESVSATVHYGSRAVAVRDTGGMLEVECSGTGPHRVRARNVVLAGGLQAKLPAHVKPSVRQFHNHDLLHRLAELPEPTENRFLVIGAGQSAAEVVEHLHTVYPNAEVHNVFAKYGYIPADDSPYANRIFDPEAVDVFYDSDIETRQRLLTYHRATNYSCVDLELINELYRREYAERVSGYRRLYMRGASELLSAQESDDGVLAEIEHHPTRSITKLRFDAVVYATGFNPVRLPDLLGDLVDSELFDGAGPVVGRDYQVETTRPTSGSIYLQGGTEHTHGLTSSLLSNIAIRSGEIVESIASVRAVACTA